MLELKKEKKLTEKDIYTMYGLVKLIHDGKIPYSVLEPVVNKYSGLIEADIKRREEEDRQSHIGHMKNALKYRKNKVETLKKEIDGLNKEIDGLNKEIVEMKAELKI